MRGDFYGMETPNGEVFDIVVAELMDHFGLGESIVPLLRRAQSRFLRPGGKIIPSRLTVFALLVDVGAPDLETTGGEAVDLWPVEPLLFKHRRLPNYPGVGDEPMGLDLDSVPWQPMSEVVEVLDIDFQHPDRFEAGLKEVVFPGSTAGTANGICWFWVADLDSEASLTTAPPSLASEAAAAGEKRRWASGEGKSRTHWQQALQAVGPVVVKKDGMTRATVQVSDSSLSWTVEPPMPEDMAKLLGGYNEVDAKLFAEHRDFLLRWAECQNQPLTELENATKACLLPNIAMRRAQLSAVLMLLSQAGEFEGIVGPVSQVVLSKLFRDVWSAE
eukprot:gnl/TRDRNA2_/TRDRNA2_166752_c0_seq1.p1 gnl/TRDRNA2_/TRDRNA2_166752_c0~~gnl/TRDRNA2_/TRDRNA2_166752_c0_seq1.p1  ORF type:complete len:331 (-),score=69.37 gnl/TRDRNA2_/TRDRNA2_166752_c0_seq1:76-1068(-)